MISLLFSIPILNLNKDNKKENKNRTKKERESVVINFLIF